MATSSLLADCKLPLKWCQFLIWLCSHSTGHRTCKWYGTYVSSKD